jgi:hypothetical protein
MTKMSLNNDFKEIDHAAKPLIPHYIADQKVDLIFHDFPPFGIAAFTESTAPAGTCVSIPQLRACHLAYPANATIAEFRSNYILHSGTKKPLTLIFQPLFGR